MNHEEFKTFSRIMRGAKAGEEPEESEEERQRRLRLERAQRLKSLARGNRGKGLPLELLAQLPLTAVWAALGLSPRVRIAPGSPFGFAHLAGLHLRALRIQSPNQTEPFPSTVSSAWFRSPLLAFYHFRSGPVISG